MSHLNHSFILSLSFMRKNITTHHSFLLNALTLLLLLITSPLYAEKDAQSSANISKVQTNIPFDQHFMAVLRNDDQHASEQAINTIVKHWHSGLIPMALETLSYANSSPYRPILVELLQQEEAVDNQNFGIREWYHWLWNADITLDPSYANFKSTLYQVIDPRFEKYFKNRHDLARIRLDEIQWGGVRQDGIPPLRNPEMIQASEASYLEDDNIVFGIEINGDVRAYPKRILAWHEMFTDTIGGVDIAGVYCTLCGTVIPYKTEVNGKKYTLGTSGFLYRSNKLMYDKATQSLWSTTRGTPVLGPLVDKGIALDYESVVTTTWGEWKKRHPKTTVLSLNTGHRRDYGEGVAYNSYFGTDELMFRTPFDDNRLKNKQEILALRFPAAPNQQLAIDTAFLEKTPLYANRIGAQQFVVFTDKSGANRVYDPQGIEFASYDGDQTAVDINDQPWTVNESTLLAKNGAELPRLPYHRAFWFGWRAAFPETKLIK